MFIEPIDLEPLKIAAIMLDFGEDLNRLRQTYPDLVTKIERIQNMIHKVKPYGLMQSTQVIAFIIDDYFEKQTLANLLREQLIYAIENRA